MEPNPPGGSGPRPNSNGQGVLEQMMQQMMQAELQKMRAQMEKEFLEREKNLKEEFRKEIETKEKAVLGMLQRKPSRPIHLPQVMKMLKA
jgi:hypothetical protein